MVGTVEGQESEGFKGVSGTRMDWTILMLKKSQRVYRARDQDLGGKNGFTHIKKVGARVRRF